MNELLQGGEECGCRAIVFHKKAATDGLIGGKTCTEGKGEGGLVAQYGKVVGVVRDLLWR